MKHLAVLLLAILAAAAVAAKPVDQAAQVIFKRSCSECPADTFCELSTKDQVACTAFGKAARELYRRYDAPPCGGSGEACCAGSTCNSNFACASGTCQPCGGEDQLCCTGSEPRKCATGNTCFSGYCTKCGTGSSPCCAESGDKPCNDYFKCTDNDPAQGVCISCGSTFSACCPTAPLCMDSNPCQSGQCVLPS